MKLEEGMAVRSKAGRDKNRVYVIIRTEGEYVYVADGDARSVRRMKRKNSRHLQPILKEQFTGSADDGRIREFIRRIAPDSETV